MVLLLLLVLSGVGARAAVAPPSGRLPRDVVPLHYALRLAIDPEAEGFSGEVRIRVRLAAAMRTIWLHARGLTITSAVAAPEHSLPAPLAAAIVDESGVLRLTAPAPLPAGEAELRLAFRGAFDVQLDGTYRVRLDGRSYVMTQMEPIAARKSFPCFDEPAFKTPWDVTLVVPAGSVAIANTRELRATPLQDGRVERVFATTGPLPSYLIAYAVGPWDVVEGEPIPPTPQRPAPVPLRGIAAHGRGPELRLALGETARLVTALEAWFDLAYPFDKLDLLAAPDFAFGAMENAGLITYHERLLLLDEDAGPEAKQEFFVTHLHELAHQWFGNSVTMPWWDDVWLNEAFATWLSMKLGATLEPTYHLEQRALEDQRGAMAEDGLASARRIAEPVSDFRDVASVFDAITYEKGAAVLAMFESFVGPERFQAAVRRHLRAHAGGTADSTDLLEAVAEGAPDAPRLVAAFRSFLDQPGVPVVSLAVECRAGEAWLAGEQRRFLPLGSEAASGRVWGLPLCVAFGREGARRRECALVSAPRFALPLAGGSCADWVMPNADAAGYYRFTLAAPDRSRLDAARASLGEGERLMVADSLEAAFDVGALTPKQALEEAAVLAGEPSWSIASVPLGPVRFLRRQVASASEAEALDAWTRRAYGPRLAALGLDDREGEDGEARREREALLALLARAGDAALRSELLGRAREALAAGPLDGGPLAPDQRAAALVVLTQDGTDAEFDGLVAALRAATDPQLRDDLLQALGAATAPDRAARVRALALDPAVRPGEVIDLLDGQLDREANRGAARAWILANGDALFARLPALHAAALPAVFAEGACSSDGWVEVERAFGHRVAALEGGPRALAQLEERIRLCAALRAEQRRRGFEDALAGPSVPVPR